MKRLLPVPILLLAACGGDAPAPAPAESAQAAVDSIPSIPTIGPDTITATMKMACTDGRAVLATYFKGPGSRVVLATEQDGPTVLPQVTSASGARYATPDGTMEWWNKGDSATWKSAKGTTQCGPNADALL
jgi:membrane-bound inhibitor of C-type lysozyme